MTVLPAALRSIPLLALALAVAAPVFARQAETGVASWYSGTFHGLRTASGESYDHDDLTAAHRSLPFGTHVRVTRLDTGASVVVRVNDRMPEGPGHAIDLSGAAAIALDLLRIGVSRVRMEVVPASEAQSRDPGTGFARPAAMPVRPASVPAAFLARGVVTLQLGAFNRMDTAEKMARSFEDAYIAEYGTPGAPLFRVYLGSFRDEAAARTEQGRLRALGHDTFLRRL